jgi:hypothetical protein
MHAQGQPVDLQAIVGNMDEEHREWFCQRYELYCRQVVVRRKPPTKPNAKRPPGPVFYCCSSRRRRRAVFEVIQALLQQRQFFRVRSST